MVSDTYRKDGFGHIRLRKRETVWVVWRTYNDKFDEQLPNYQYERWS